MTLPSKPDAPRSLVAEALAGVTGGTQTIVGTAANDTLQSSDAGEVLQGGNGSDLVVGWGGHDTLQGGSGADTLFDGAGNDCVSGDDGADHLREGLGDDQMFGGQGNDSIYWRVGYGNDTLRGGDGVDKLSLGILDMTPEELLAAIRLDPGSATPKLMDGFIDVTGVSGTITIGYNTIRFSEIERLEAIFNEAAHDSW